MPFAAFCIDQKSCISKIAHQTGPINFFLLQSPFMDEDSSGCIRGLM